VKIELPEKPKRPLRVEPTRMVFPPRVMCAVRERELASSLETQSTGVPFKTGRGKFAKYGPAPSAEEIDANRADMFRNFGEAKDFS
jgi:hypothetical protein